MPTKPSRLAKSKARQKTPIHHHAFHSVWPHRKNGYRPHLIRPIGLALVIGLAFGLQVNNYLPKPEAEPLVMGEAVDKTQDDLLTYTNNERFNNELPPLQLDDKLSEAARLKAEDIIERQYWAHNAPDGTTPWHWFREVNYRYDYAGENLAKGFNNTQAVIDAWMNSPEHRDNILNKNYEDVGFAAVSGVLEGESTQIIVAMYASPVGLSKSEAEPSVLSAAEGKLNPIAQFGITLKSMGPMELGSIVLLAGAAVVALLAHAYRNKLPAPVRKSWKGHHGLYKFFGLITLIIIVVGLYGTGNL